MKKIKLDNIPHSCTEKLLEVSNTMDIMGYFLVQSVLLSTDFHSVLRMYSCILQIKS